MNNPNNHATQLTSSNEWAKLMGEFPKENQNTVAMLTNAFIAGIIAGKQLDSEKKTANQ